MFLSLDISGVVKLSSGSDSIVLSSQILDQVPHWEKVRRHLNCLALHATVARAWHGCVCPTPSEAATSQLLAQHPV
jgi:hypothetical protein